MAIGGRWKFTMENEAFLQTHALVTAEAARLAVVQVKQMGLPERQSFDLDRIANLGPKFVDRARRMDTALNGHYDGHVDALIAYAVRRMWLALWENAYYFQEGAKHGLMGDNDYCRSFMTAEGSGQNEGWSSVSVRPTHVDRRS